MNPLDEFNNPEKNMAIYQELRKWVLPSHRELRDSHQNYLYHLKHESKHYER